MRTVDGFEPNEFRNLFPFWHNTQTSGNKMKTTVLGRIDTKILTERASLAAETQLIDDGAGDVMIYKVGKSNLVKVPKRHAHCLFSTESYVIHYTLMVSVIGFYITVEHNLVSFCTCSKTNVVNIDQRRKV